SLLWGIAKERSLTNVDKTGAKWNENFVPYTFKNDAALSDRPSKQTIHLEFWGSQQAYNVDWIYDRTNNIYKRNNANVAHIDRDTNKQLTAKNIAVLFMPESHANDGYDNNVHLLYKDIGSGKARIYMDGKETTA